jgi:tRNA U34 5-carboxymethylaminomethyl modifying GTPase MnmE/TrmE
MELLKRLNSIFSKIEEKADDLDSASEEIQAQALLETLELLSTYSLAQTLKDKDRLAVADIQRAEKRLGGTVGYIPFYDNNPLEIITAYMAVNKKFQNRLNLLRNQWKDIYYYNPTELDFIDKDLSDKLQDANQNNVNKFITNFDQNNDKDAEMFNKMFNKDNLKGIISK